MADKQRKEKRKNLFRYSQLASTRRC